MAASCLHLIRQALLAGLTSLLLIAPSASHAANKRVDNQQALSRAIGEFRASRYVVFKGCDAQDCHFQEAGKFGPILGPSDRFHVARQVIDFDGAPVGEVAVYEHNQGRFRVGYPSHAKVIEADFKEPFTKEEESYRSAVAYLQKLPTGDTSQTRWHVLKYAMLSAYHAQHPDEAARYAQQLLAYAAMPKFKNEVSVHIHPAHTILGLVAIEMGDVVQAKSQLQASIEGRATSSLTGFGPNMRLAQALLQAGESSAVLAYLRDCQRFWNRPELSVWISDVQAGREPNFGANLKYGLY